LAPQWTSLNGNLRITEFMSVAYDSNAKLLFGGAQDNGVSYQMLSGNPVWTIPATPAGKYFSNDLGGDGNTEAVDNSVNPSIRYSMGNFPGYLTPAPAGTLISTFHRMTYSSAPQDTLVLLEKLGTPIVFSGLVPSDRASFTDGKYRHIRFVLNS